MNILPLSIRNKIVNSIKITKVEEVKNLYHWIFDDYTWHQFNWATYQIVYNKMIAFVNDLPVIRVQYN